MGLFEKFKDLNERLKSDFRKDDILEFERLISKLDKNQDIELEFYKGKAIEITKVAKKIDGLLSDLNFIRKENEEIFNILSLPDSKLRTIKKNF